MQCLLFKSLFPREEGFAINCCFISPGSVLSGIAMLCLMLQFEYGEITSVVKYCSEMQYLQILIASYLKLSVGHPL